MLFTKVSERDAYKFLKRLQCIPKSRAILTPSKLNGRFVTLFEKPLFIDDDFTKINMHMFSKVMRYTTFHWEMLTLTEKINVVK